MYRLPEAEDPELVSGSDSELLLPRHDAQETCLRLPRGAARAALAAGILLGALVATVVLAHSSTAVEAQTSASVGLDDSGFGDLQDILGDTAYSQVKEAAADTATPVIQDAVASPVPSPTPPPTPLPTPPPEVNDVDVAPPAPVPEQVPSPPPAPPTTTIDAQKAASMWANVIGQTTAPPVAATAATPAAAPVAATATAATPAAAAVAVPAATPAVATPAAATTAPAVTQTAAASAATAQSAAVSQAVAANTTAAGTDLSDLATQFAAEALKYDPTSDEAKQYASIAAMVQKANQYVSTTQALAAPAAAVAAPVATMAPTAVAIGATTTNNAALSQYAPQEGMSDGNKCPDDEEEYPTPGTCFKKCSDLTGGVYPVRTSPFSCCKAQPCSFSNTKSHFNFCGGFDVSGDSEGKGCPSAEGACLTDEELFDGICYKKCSSFDTTFHHRVAPNMCCKTSGFSCLLPPNFKFSADYATGGGAGDGTQATPGQPHAPIQGLTESSSR